MSDSEGCVLASLTLLIFYLFYVVVAIVIVGLLSLAGLVVSNFWTLVFILALILLLLSAVL